LIPPEQDIYPQSRDQLQIMHQLRSDIAEGMSKNLIRAARMYESHRGIPFRVCELSETDYLTVLFPQMSNPKQSASSESFCLEL
jgi:hypothetical protein